MSCHPWKCAFHRSTDEAKDLRMGRCACNDGIGVLLGLGMADAVRTRHGCRLRAAGVEGLSCPAEAAIRVHVA